ncbi:MAG: ATP-binding cassette domain-containing protein [Desulfococcaceae bacterium]
MEIQIKIRKKLVSRGRHFTLESAFVSEEKFVVLFGPSGSGKTMTLKAVAGLLRPDGGRIAVGPRVLFDSEKRIDIPARDRGIGYLFQDYALFPHLNVAENVGFGLKKRWQWRLCVQDQKQVEEFMDIFEILPLAKALPRDLSGGQRQRVALARALICKPDLLLLDEPFSALDPLLRARLRNGLREIQSRFQVPVIMITHDPEDIDAFAETLVVYETGQVRHISPFYRQTKKDVPAECFLRNLHNCPV